MQKNIQLILIIEIFLKLKNTLLDWISQQLINWFQINKRDLPWRKKRNPYSVWISEIMLQQTQVVTVIPYYLKWIKSLPSIESVSKADEDFLLKLWQGLGYYSRVRNIHKAAKWMVLNHQGQFPKDYQQIINLPGIGNYTAGAISSIAFGKRVVFVDGNVERVLARFFALEEPIEQLRSQKIIWNLAEKLLPKKNIDDFNESLMELGATLCTPTKGFCTECPLGQKCLAFKKNKVNKIPFRQKKIKTIKRTAVSFVLYQNNFDPLKKETKYLLYRRRKNEIMGGLFEFPTIDQDEFKKINKLLFKKKEILEDLFKKKYGFMIKIKDSFFSLKHSYTKYRVDLEVFFAFFKADEKNNYLFNEMNSNLCWVNRVEFERCPMNSSGAKIAKKLFSLQKKFN